jgi:Icc-related predicted phosphoesterase
MSSIKALSLSDIPVQFIYSSQVRRRFADAEIVIGCGDLPYYYLEYVLGSLDVPLYYVRGNHDKETEYEAEGERVAPVGGVNLHRKVVNEQGLLLAGVEGSLRYRTGPFQYSQKEMWFHIFSLIPALLVNRALYGRYLDVFVTHSPPAGIHDKSDLPHQGIKAFRWFIEVFQPGYHLHGHIHIYRPDAITETKHGQTRVINTFGFRETTIEYAPAQWHARFRGMR